MVLNLVSTIDSDVEKCILGYLKNVSLYLEQRQNYKIVLCSSKMFLADLSHTDCIPSSQGLLFGIILRCQPYEEGAAHPAITTDS